MSPVILIRHPSASEYARILRSRYPDFRVEIAQEERLADQLEAADILLALRFPAQMIEHAGRLRWFQATGAGVDSIMAVADRLPGMIITNARGIHGDVIADYVLTGITIMKNDMRQLFADQAERKWSQRSLVPLSAMTLGVVGLGAIGSEICRRAKSAGMTVIGSRRNGSLPSDHVDEVYPADRLPTMLSRCDAVVLAVPKTPETVGMMGAAEFESMKPSAILVNISRGDVVNEPELIAALQSKTIGGAILDVFQHEPLPQESPLWTMPNVMVTPHLAGGAVDYVDRMLSVFCDNLDSFLNGASMRNIVDPNRGY